jgi:hypothetical protein
MRQDLDVFSSYEGGGVMDIMTLTQARMMARRLRRAILATVIFADDRVFIVKVGPRGGWNIVN